MEKKRVSDPELADLIKRTEGKIEQSKRLRSEADALEEQTARERKALN